MSSVADLLVAGMGIAPLEHGPEAVPAGTRCALTGVALTSGYPIEAIQKTSQGEFLDTFRGQQTGYVSESVARLFIGGRNGDWNMGAWLCFADGTAYHPLISSASAAGGERPAWRDLVRDIWPTRQGENLVCILTTDTKKRLWPRARVGALGTATPVYLHDGEMHISRSADMDWSFMLSCLQTIETVYNAGFSKRAISAGLYSEWKMVTNIGLSETRILDARLAPLRGHDEFLMALLIAQKEIRS